MEEKIKEKARETAGEREGAGEKNRTAREETRALARARTGRHDKIKNDQLYAPFVRSVIFKIGESPLLNPSSRGYKHILKSLADSACSSKWRGNLRRAQAHARTRAKNF